MLLPFQGDVNTQNLITPGRCPGQYAFGPSGRLKSFALLKCSLICF